MEEFINFNCHGKIWNTAFSENLCVLEIRDESTRQVSFSGINLLSGKVLWENLRPEKSWWLSLAGIFGKYLILNKYSAKQKPEPEGFLILNAKSGEMVKSVEDWIFFDVQRDVIKAYQLQDNGPIYKTIDLLPSSAEKIVLEKSASTNEQSNNLSNPILLTHYSDASPHFITIYKFLYRILNIDAVKGIDYLEINDKIIISYYIYRDKLFQNYLLVTNRVQTILINDLIAETEGIGIDTFTVKSDTLLYVKNQIQFVGYRL